MERAWLIEACIRSSIQQSQRKPEAARLLHRLSIRKHNTTRATPFGATPETVLSHTCTAFWQTLSGNAEQDILSTASRVHRRARQILGPHSRPLCRSDHIKSVYDVLD